MLFRSEAKKFPIKENEKTSPLNPYAASKIAAEKQILSYAKKFHLPYSILRYANVYGPRQRADSEGGVISIFSNNILQKKPIKIFGDGTQTRDFIYVHDVTRANYLSLFSRSSFIANVSSNKEVSILKLARLIERLSGKKAKIIFKPKKAGEITKSRLDNFHLKHVLKWQPEVGVQTGLSKTLKYLDGK